MHIYMITGTNDSHKVPMVNYLEEATVSSDFKRLAWRTTTNKVGWSIPGSNMGLHVNLQEIILQSRQRYTNYPGIYSCTKT